MSALPVLIITREGETLKSLPLDSEVSIGRAEGNVIRLEDRAVSRKHAVVRKTLEGVQIEKQSDFAPIRLNGVECTRALLKEGDVVEIGPFRMHLDQKREKGVAPVSSPATVLEFPTPSAPPSTPNAEETLVLAENPGFPQAEIPSAVAGTDTLDVPSENIVAENVGGVDLGGGASLLAEPILADSQGADSVAADPGTNIFTANAPADASPLPELNIDFNLSGDFVPQAGPSEITASFDENAATRVGAVSLDARLDIPDGLANVKSIDLNQPEIYIGRGKECDVVLNDKKASRKNAVIAKVGNRYVLRDLESANGTYVNGQSVREHELSGDDRIRIGEVEMRFIALNPDYERKKDQFLPVDPSPSEAPYEALPGNPVGPDYGLGISSPTAGYLPDHPIESPGGAPAPTPSRGGLGGIYDKYIKNFSSLRPVQKLLVVLCVGLFLSWYFEDELGLGDRPTAQQRNQQQVVKKMPDGKPIVIADYDRLAPEKKQQIDDAVRKATDFLRQMDFDKAIYEVQQKIYPILPEYAQAKEIERYAQEGKRRKEAIAEEARKKEEEEKLKERIADLERQTRSFMQQKKYEEAKEVFSEILTLDPENASVADWKKEIEAWMEEQARLEQERLVQEEINKRAWDTYREAYDLHKAGKYREAIVVYRKVPELGTNDEALLKKARTMVKASQDSLRELRDPHLRTAKELEALPDLAGAYREYQAATEVDPQHPDGWAGMERIRDILTDRAKILYTEAVIAESYSDFKTAHGKFNEILKVAPEGSLYYQRAQRKLQSYLNFKSEEEAMPQ